MKKAFYISMVLISMGFTTISITEHIPARPKKVENKQAPRQGYLEVVSPQSYSLTAGY